MVSTAGGIVIGVVVLLVLAAVGWIVFTQLRARRFGLPPPSLSSYLPWKTPERPYGPPRPAPGGVIGWFNDQIRKFKNRNNRSAAGAYEQQSGGGGGRHGFGPLDPDEAWDSRVGNEADTDTYYGYYDERDRRGGGGHRTSDSVGGGYAMNLAGPYEQQSGGGERERGRTMGGGGGQGGRGLNPFDDDAAVSLRGVSPRPMEGGIVRNSVEGRRSAFREEI